MFVFPDEGFRKCPPDDAETIEPCCRVSKTKTKKETAFSIRFLNNAAVKKALRIFQRSAFCVEKTMR